MNLFEEPGTLAEEGMEMSKFEKCIGITALAVSSVLEKETRKET